MDNAIEAKPATLQESQQELTAARHLAAAGEAHQYLTFALAGEMYAVGILNVKEIIEYGNLTEIPMMPTRYQPAFLSPRRDGRGQLQAA